MHVLFNTHTLRNLNIYIYINNFVNIHVLLSLANELTSLTYSFATWETDCYGQLHLYIRFFF